MVLPEDQQHVHKHGGNLLLPRPEVQLGALHVLQHGSLLQPQHQGQPLGLHVHQQPRQEATPRRAQ